MLQSGQEMGRRRENGGRGDEGVVCWCARREDCAARRLRLLCEELCASLREVV